MQVLYCTHWFFFALAEAKPTKTKYSFQIYKEEPNIIREGNELSTLLELRKALPNANILVLPLTNNESNPSTERENISLKCYIESTKLITNYLHHLSICSKKRTKQ